VGAARFRFVMGLGHPAIRKYHPGIVLAMRLSVRRLFA